MSVRICYHCKKELVNASDPCTPGPRPGTAICTDKECVKAERKRLDRQNQHTRKLHEQELRRNIKKYGAGLV